MALPPLSSRVVCGALAGVVAMAPMTAVMHRLHRGLGGKDRYPLPPREIVSSIAPQIEDDRATSITLLAHYLYGASSGAALALVIPKPTIAGGITGGLAIWLVSYMGWIPVFGIMKPANQHPITRNALMTVAHVVWGAAYALADRDLMRSRSAFGRGPLKDAINLQAR